MVARTHRTHDKRSPRWFAQSETAIIFKQRHVVAPRILEMPVSIQLRWKIRPNFFTLYATKHADLEQDHCTINNSGFGLTLGAFNSRMKPPGWLVLQAVPASETCTLTVTKSCRGLAFSLSVDKVCWYGPKAGGRTIYKRFAIEARP